MSISNIIPPFQQWLKKHIGFSPEIISHHDCLIKIQSRMAIKKINDANVYYQFLLDSEKEQKAIIETMIVPETWFFREHGSLDFLPHFVKTHWLPSRPTLPLRILSVACSSGEEPYSIAMNLFNIGLSPNQFSIDAVDISTVALEKAREGIYGRNSFRSKDLTFRDLYFTHIKDDLYQLNEAVKNQATFRNVNIIDNEFTVWPFYFDVIFCRNVLIYLTRHAQKQLFNFFDDILTDNGLVILGHVEAELIKDSGYVPIKYPKACVFRKVEAILSEGVTGLEKPKKAIAHPKEDEAVAKNKATHDVKNKKSIIHQGQDKKTDAIIKKDAKQEDLLDQALDFANRGLLEQAKKLCQKYLKTSATDVEGNFLLGTLYHALSDEKKAEEYFQKVVYLDPYHDEALVYLALFAEKKGDFERASLFKMRVLKALAKKKS